MEFASDNVPGVCKVPRTTVRVEDTNISEGRRLTGEPENAHSR